MCSIILVAKFLEKLHYLATKQNTLTNQNTCHKI